MEFVDGVDVSLLVTLSEQQGALISPRLAATIVRDAALGLDHAHNAEVDGRALSVVHRDVSPQNIMVRRDGVVKVVDFGLALATNRVHQTQSADTIKGKVRYMSPEQANAEPLDARTDQFALGVVLWELLAGRGMFETNNPLIVLRELTQERARTPLAHNPAAPPALAAIAMRMLERDRTRRYPGLADAAEALRVVLESMAGDHRAELAAFVEGIAGRHLRERQFAAGDFDRSTLTRQVFGVHHQASGPAALLAPIQKVALSFLSASQAPISEHRRDLSVSLHVSSGPLPIDPGR